LRKTICDELATIESRCLDMSFRPARLQLDSLAPMLSPGQRQAVADLITGHLNACGCKAGQSGGLVMAAVYIAAIVGARGEGGLRTLDVVASIAVFAVAGLLTSLVAMLVRRFEARKLLRRLMEGFGCSGAVPGAAFQFITENVFESHSESKRSCCR
jgi:hypothetical protein